jgi:hypothetical protein
MPALYTFARREDGRWPSVGNIAFDVRYKLISMDLPSSFPKLNALILHPPLTSVGQLSISPLIDDGDGWQFPSQVMYFLSFAPGPLKY